MKKFPNPFLALFLGSALCPSLGQAYDGPVLESKIEFLGTHKTKETLFFKESYSAGFMGPQGWQEEIFSTVTERKPYSKKFEVRCLFCNPKFFTATKTAGLDTTLPEYFKKPIPKITEAAFKSEISQLDLNFHTGEISKNKECKIEFESFFYDLYMPNFTLGISAYLKLPNELDGNRRLKILDRRNHSICKPKFEFFWVPLAKALVVIESGTGTNPGAMCLKNHPELVVLDLSDFPEILSHPSGCFGT